MAVSPTKQWLLDTCQLSFSAPTSASEVLPSKSTMFAAPGDSFELAESGVLQLAS